MDDVPSGDEPAKGFSPFSPASWLRAADWAAVAAVTTGARAALGIGDLLDSGSRALSGLPGPGADLGTWISAFKTSTAFWIDPSAQPQGVDLLALGDRIVAQIVDGFARRFVGQRFRLAPKGRQLELTLDGIASVHSATGSDVAFDLKDVQIDDHGRVASVAGVARGAKLRPGIGQASLTVDGFDMTVEVDAQTIIDSLPASITDNWEIELLGSGRVFVRRLGASIGYELDPEVVDGRFRGVGRAVHLGKRRLQLPKWVHVERTLEIPELPAGAKLLHAEAQGPLVRARLDLPSMRQNLNLDTIRRAITSGRLDVLFSPAEVSPEAPPA